MAEVLTAARGSDYLVHSFTARDRKGASSHYRQAIMPQGGGSLSAARQSAPLGGFPHG
jgi:hypothetical protein